jgi:threonine dehydratase|tara:strand:- start:405 stop:1376 length:972 start_codon:yes stop_codon:yes gene_type:complete
MTSVNLEDVQSAYSRIEKYLSDTGVVSSERLDNAMDAEIYLKPEHLQRTGSFKFRGAMSAMTLLSKEQLKNGVIAFSSGNHAQGVACAAKILKSSAVIVMPSDAPEIKIQNTKSYGAKVIFYDRQKDNREKIGESIALNENRTLIKPFDSQEVIAGQGTSALEAVMSIEDQDRKFDAAIVCASGGGFTAGTAIALKAHNSNCFIYTAEPKNWNDHELSFEANKRIFIKNKIHGICDALESPFPGEITFEINNRLGVKGISVDDDAIIQAMRFAYNEFNFILEPSGAIALACLMSSRSTFKGKKVLIMLSGGNISSDQFNAFIS